MTKPTPTPATEDWLIEGYRRALKRFDDTRHGRDREERFYPLFEALNWAAAITDPESSLRASVDPLKDSTVRGLRYVRNRVHHDWAIALDAGDVSNPQTTPTRAVGRVSRIIAPPTVVEWFWKPFPRLPPPPAKRPDRKGQAAYKARLEGTPVRHALEHLEALLPVRRSSSAARTL